MDATRTRIVEAQWSIGVCVKVGHSTMKDVVRVCLFLVVIKCDGSWDQSELSS